MTLVYTLFRCCGVGYELDCVFLFFLLGVLNPRSMLVFRTMLRIEYAYVGPTKTLMLARVA